MGTCFAICACNDVSRADDSETCEQYTDPSEICRWLLIIMQEIQDLSAIIRAILCSPNSLGLLKRQEDYIIEHSCPSPL